MQTQHKTKRRLRTIWCIPDDLWVELQRLLPPEKPPGTRGRPAIPFRRVTDGIFYVLRTGCQWKALPREYGSGSTSHRRFQQWVQAGVFERLWAKLLTRYDDLRGIHWKWQALDSVMIKAPLGGRNRAESDGSGENRDQAPHTDRSARRAVGRGDHRG